VNRFFSSLQIAVFLLLFVLAGMFCCFAEDAPLFGFGDPDTPWHIEADTLHYLGNDQYSAVGGVVISSGERRIHADTIRFDSKKRELLATGHVVIKSGDDVLTGDRMEMSLASETGTVYGGELFFGKNHFYIAGDRIEKVGPDAYKVDRFKVTTCDPKSPDWQFTGRDLSFTMEGYGSMRQAAFWAKNVPLLYVPYLFFPVKTKRQSGLLVPEINYSSEDGAGYTQPLFWAINDSSDLTTFSHYMTRRGARMGAEYRQAFSEDSKIVIMMEGLHDRQRNKEVTEGDYGYDGDAWARPNSDRYWFRMKQDHAFSETTTARLDLDVVSDQDYLKEFDSAYMGFKKTDDFFEKYFGRDLDEENETIRTNNLSLNRLWASHSLNAALRWEDDVIKRRWEDEDTTVQRLPVVMLNAVRQLAPGLPLSYDLESEYTFCFRRDGAKGHRTDIHPRLYLPLYWHNFLAFEPSAGIRETAWWMDTPDPLYPSMDKNQTRTAYDMRLDLSSELDRVFSLNQETGTKLQHALLPRVVYDHVISQEEDDPFPEFDDSLDTIEEERLITYGLENVFTLKKLAGGEKKAPEAPDFRYREICRFNIWQSYDIKEARGNDPADWSNGTSRRPFSPIMVELDLRPANHLRLDMDAGWDKYKHGWSEYDFKMALADNRGDVLHVAYRYDRDIAESIRSRGTLVLNRLLRLYAEHEHNFFDHLDIETSAGFIYSAYCWSLDVSFTDEPDDDSVSFMIRLNGLSDIKTDITGDGPESSEAN
jgi:LPS-assembly protein